MKTNDKLQTDVQNAITMEPLLHLVEIAVTVKDGVVTLTGTVDSYLKKIDAENTTQKVVGVKGIVENIEVRFPSNWTKTDTEVANEVFSALRSNYKIPNDKVTIKVEKGWVTLEGELPCNYQRQAAKNAVSNVSGVKGVFTYIKIKSESNNEMEKYEVEKAISRNLYVADCDINVEVSGTTLTLSGQVLSWYQKEEAERIAWSSLGIWHIKNELQVGFENAF